MPKEKLIRVPIESKVGNISKVTLPSSAKVLSCVNQNEDLYVYALCADGDELLAERRVERSFRFLTIGMSGDVSDCRFVNVVSRNHSNTIYHFFEVVEEG